MRKMQSVNLLIELLAKGSDDDPDAEWKAAIALGDVQSPEQKHRSVLALLESLTSGHSHALIRAHAAESLGRLGDRQAVTSLITALHDPYRLVRAYSTGALAALGDTRAIKPLLELLEIEDYFGVRAEVIKAIGVLSTQLDNALHQHVRDVLKQQREDELERSESGTDRVLAEIDRALYIFKKEVDESEQSGY